MATSADCEFRHKRSKIPLGIGGYGSNPAVIGCSNLRVFSVMDNPYESGFNITFTDFKLRKESSAGASFKISRAKERIYAIIDGNELEPIYTIMKLS